MYGRTVVEAENHRTIGPFMYTKGHDDSPLSGRPLAESTDKSPTTSTSPGCRFHPRCPARMPVCGQEAPSMVQGWRNGG
jgi:ABC-type dipeptide/oligopeptide/nickel transport system ATPase component